MTKLKSNKGNEQQKKKNAIKELTIGTKINCVCVASIQSNNNELFDFCVQNPNFNCKYRKSIALKLACKLGNVYAATKLLSSFPGLNPAIKKNYPLCIACTNGHLEIVELLLKHNVDPNEPKDSPIITACESRNIEMVNLLMRYGANPTAKNNAPVKIAARTGNIQLVKFLFDSGLVDKTNWDLHAV